MLARLGLGPVFGLECLTASRRWQLYFGRTIFVGLLLTGMWILWESAGGRTLFPNELQNLAAQLFQTVVLVQLAMVMLIAPAVTAGSICVDKGRGTLHHVFVTDLSAREIILGKLGSRLLSVFALMACCAPVLALGGLLGGLDYEALLRAFIITAGVAVLSCSLALFFSIWVKKPHQALLPTYAVLGLWCVGLVPLAWMLRDWLPVGDPRYLQQIANPIYAVVASYTEDDRTRWVQPLAFLIATLGPSAVLMLIAVRKLRRVVIGQANRPVKRQRADAPLRLLDYLPGPPLDGNPILWREWHRKKPGRWTGRLWALYAAFSLLASGYVLLDYFLDPGRSAHSLAATVNATEVTIGLLLLTISATTALAEERDRGSLDIIMTTPLSTAEILRGKWLGTFAMVPRLAILPLWVGAGLALVSGQWLAPFALLALILGYSAFIASLGLAFATWIPRVGRAIAAGLLAVILLNVGLVLARNLMTSWTSMGSSYGPYASGYAPWGQPQESPSWDFLLLGSPFQGVAEATRWGGQLSWRNLGSSSPPDVYISGRTTGYLAVFAWAAVLAGFAAWLFAATVASFDRFLGRMTTDLRLDKPPTRDPIRRRKAAVDSA